MPAKKNQAQGLVFFSSVITRNIAAYLAKMLRSIFIQL